MSNGRPMNSVISWLRRSSQYFTDQPPWANPPLGSSSGPPGACITPSSVRNVVTLSLRIACPPPITALIRSLRTQLTATTRTVTSVRRQVPVLHLPGVVEHVVSRVAEQVRDRPVAERLALRVPRAHRLDEAVAVMGEPLRRQQVLQLGLRLHPLGELATLVGQDMPNDPVPGAAATPDTWPEIRRDAGGRFVELGPRRAEQPHLAVEGWPIERLAVERRGR